jgi:lipoate-protein ligase B
MGIAVHNMGSVPFGRALELQGELREEVRRGGQDGSILVLEHPEPVITLGRRGGELLYTEEGLARRGIGLFPLSRGGEATAHEPGQLVVYFILPVESKAASFFVRKALAPLVECSERVAGILPRYDESRPGLWCHEMKIASVGFDLRGGVSMHGLALNVNNSLETFRFIRPCGMETTELASLARISGRELDMERVLSLAAELYARHFLES